MSDMQYLNRLLTSLSIDENYGHDATDEENIDSLSAKNVHKYIQRVMYNRRTEFNPLWNHLLIAGLDAEDKPFLSSVDLLGTVFSSPSLATGFGAHLAQPIMRKSVPDEAASQKLSAEDAVAIIKECMKVLFYRDARSLDRYSIGVITKGGVEIKEDEQLENQSWQFAERIRGYGTQTN